MIFRRIIKSFFIIFILLTQFSSNARPLTVLEKESADLFYKADRLNHNKKYEESIYTLNLALEKSPNFIRAYYAKSGILTKLGRFQEAIETCNKALKINQNEPKILAQKALCLYFLKKYKESLKTSELAVKHGPKNHLAYEVRASNYGIFGNLEKALEDYNKVLELVSNHNTLSIAETYLNRFCPLYQLKRYDEALATCNKALEITNDASKLPQIYSKKALVLNKFGKHKEALENAEKALEIDTKDPLAISEKKTSQSKLKDMKI